MKNGLLIIGFIIFLSLATEAQEIWIFSEGTDQTYYDQGIVDVANLGSSLFEHTSPPGFLSLMTRSPVPLRLSRDPLP